MKKIFFIAALLFPLLMQAQIAQPGYSASGIITTVAGNGTPGYSGDGVAASATRIYYPFDVAVDRGGNVYIADTYNDRIRMVSSTGTITTVAGSGGFGFYGDGGAATAAYLYYPFGVTVDRSGNIYIADYYNCRIRKVNSSGIISTFAGNGTIGSSGDGGAATNAELYYPMGLATDGAGNVYIADEYNHRIRKIDSNGIITTIAGTGTNGYSGDGGAATAAQLYYPTGVAVDSLGNVYIADYYNFAIRKINSSGTISTYAGTGIQGFSGDGGAATAGKLYYAWGVAVDTRGNVYIGDADNTRVRKVNSSGIINTIAGNGEWGYTGDGVPATSTGLYYPTGMAVDQAGNVYIADSYNSRIRRINAYITNICAGSTTTLSDSTSGGTWSSNNTAIATINATSGVVTGVSAGIDTLKYTVGSSHVSLVLTVNPLPNAGGITGSTTICAGSGITLTESASGGIWSVNNNHVTISGDSTTTLIVSGVTGGTSAITYTVSNSCGSAYASSIITVNPNPGIILGSPYVRIDSTIALSATVSGGSWSSSSTGIATVNSSGIVHGVAAGSAIITYGFSNSCGTYYATYRVTVPGTSYYLISQAISTIAGNGTYGYSGDGGQGTAAKMSYTYGVAADASGNVYVADAYNHRIRKINTSGIISTFAGTGTAGFTGDGAAATAADLYYPCGVATDEYGNVYIADTYNFRIRKVSTGGVITTVAGNGYALYSGEGGPATAAGIYYPYALAVDRGGNIYLSDYYYHAIRKVNSAGIISTLAGTGTPGYSGDGGAATAAELYYPWGVAADTSGNVYIADYYNFRIRKVNTSGIISTYAGNGSAGFGGDGAAATAANIYYALGVATDRSGNVYVADYDNLRIRKINAGGTISTFAGDGSYGFSGDKGPATAAALYYPYSVCNDGNGNTYLGDLYNYRVRKVGDQYFNLPVITGTNAVCVGKSITLADSLSGGVWSSSNPGKATINSSTGIVMGVDTGSTIISYSYSGGYRTFSMTVHNVYPVTISGTTTVCATDAITLSETTTGGTWSSGSTSIATVASTGVVTGVLAGTAVISYIKTGCYVTRAITVNTNPLSEIAGLNAVCMGNVITLSNTVSGGTWSSSNSALASVDGSGDITGVAAGSAVITYMQSSGCYKIAAVGVGTPIYAPIAGVPKVCTGNVTSLSDDTTGGTWSSGNTAAAIVSGSGGIIGIAAGTSVITYTRTGCYVTQSVTVNTNPLSAITGPSAVCMGSTVTLMNSISGGIWSSSHTSFASADSLSGHVTGVAAGSSIITYMLSSGCYKASSISVGTPITTSITGTPSVCTANVTYLYNTTTGGAWSSSATTVATVSGTGVVTGVSSGTATISYSRTGCYVSQLVTVSTNLLSAITGTNVVCVGNVTTLYDSTSGGSWSSSYSGYATINNVGWVSGTAAGTPMITYAEGGCYRTKLVTVNGTYPAGISGNEEVCTGNITSLTDSTTGGTWTSGTTTVATISTAGVLTGVASGVTTITYKKIGCSVTKSVTVNTNPLSANTGPTAVCVGNTITLANSTSGGIWVSNHPAFATVDSVGHVTGVAVGAPVITYTVSNACYRTSSITVNYTYPASVSGTASVCAGDVTSLTDATTGGTWTSGATTVATVAGSGAVTGVAAGTTSITYTKAGCSVTIPVTVNTNPLSAISGPTAVCNGNTITLANSTLGGTWSSSQTSFATVNSTGAVTSVAAGTTIITYMLSSGCYRTSSIGVGSVITTAITGTPSVCAGGSKTTLADATAGGTWTSGTTSIATVSGSTGVVSGVVSGIATITYTKTGCFITQPVTVNANSLAANTGITTICAGNSTTLANTTSGGTWASSNTADATVGSSSGIVTGVAAGAPMVTYMLGSGCFKTSNVSVGAPITTAIIGTATVCAGGSKTTLADSTAGGTWSSGTTSIATIASTGIVTGVAAGTSTITYTKTGCHTMQSVTVNTNPLAANTGTTAVCIGSTTTLSNSTAGGTWASSNTADATVGNSTGIVSGAVAGALMITYTIGSGCYKTSNVSVHNPPSTISGSGAVCTSIHDTLTNTTSGGTWTSSATTKATVGATTGIVTGHAAGTATISYTVAGCAVATHPITVSVRRIGDIENSLSSATGETTNHYSIYPNPSNGIINIVQSNPDDITADVKVMNYLGQAVYSGTVAFSGGGSQVYLEKVAPGVYMIELKDTKGQTANLRLVIEK